MQNMQAEYGQKRSTRFLYALLLIVCCVGINMLGSALVDRLHIILFLDSIGTVLAAVLGGYIPGILVGYLTNLVGGISDLTNIYYAVLNVLIAVSATYLSRKGYFRSLKNAFVPVLVFSFIGGCLGTGLTWLMYGFDFGSGISAPLAHTFYNSGHFTRFWAQFTADILIDLADKVVTVIAATLLLRPVSEPLRRKLDFENWYGYARSNYRAAERRKAGKSFLTRDLSLRGKVVLLVSIATIVIALVTSSLSFLLYHRSTIEDHIKLAKGTATLVAAAIDPEMVDVYLEEGEAADGYLETRELLQSVRESSSDIEYVYVYQIREDGCHVVFDLDTAALPGEKPGTVVPFDESFGPYLPTLLAGGMIEPLITDDTYGWLMTVYQPVFDADGVCRCYAGVDISMHMLSLSEMSFITKIVSLFLGFFILILATGLYVAQNNIILPINTMANAADDFAYSIEDDRNGAVERFQELNIRTGDEIENLYRSFSKTIEESVGYIEAVQRQGEVISKMQNGLIMVLADMVESRDKCTGDHVRKTAAYTKIIMEQMRKDGTYADQLTDEFISDVYNSAPLHDVGKIQVSDTLLNKPGRLTDEEFEKMKLHTTAGGDVIAQAIALVSDSGYLQEAKNLAAYHHERWDGTGYPTGLAGEDIPLSARIMAVADVFDALVSRRSYKEPFSFEKAMDIIKEESGTHFDPAIVDAFVKAEEEVRRVAKMHMDRETL